MSLSVAHEKLHEKVEEKKQTDHQLQFQETRLIIEGHILEGVDRNAHDEQNRQQKDNDVENIVDHAASEAQFARHC